jgi:hypothetical protein
MDGLVARARFAAAGRALRAVGSSRVERKREWAGADGPLRPLTETRPRTVPVGVQNPDIAADAPFSGSSPTTMTIAAVVPLTPLLLFRYPIADLAQKFFSQLIGL